VVNPTLPVHSVADLIKLARERPLSYGSAGPGTFHHLSAELFSTAVGIKMAHLPYKGSAPALNALVAGHVQVMSLISRHRCSSFAAGNYVRSG
jgi:tripartite-type tricarboxylate transporter receptor subunit TctC